MMTYDSVESYERHNQIKHRHYIPVYKCLMCGQEIELENREYKEDVVKRCLETMLNDSSSIDFYGHSFSFHNSKDYMIHNCGNDKIGVAQLIGMKFHRERMKYR